jgi:hypothetical protein
VTRFHPQITPSTCRHCGKWVAPPVGFMGLLYVLRPGRGRNTSESRFKSVAQLRALLSVSRQRVYQLVEVAERKGCIYQPFGKGTRVYGNTAKGRIYVQAWLRAGYEFFKAEVAA